VHRSRLILAVVAALVTALAVASYAAARPSSSSAVVPVKVSAKEYRFTLSKVSFKVGTTATFTLTNRGNEPHDFKITRPLTKKTPVILNGRSAKFTLKLTKKGRYSYLCTVGRHAADGMAGSFVVK
jgi:plastocyanin